MLSLSQITTITGARANARSTESSRAMKPAAQQRPGHLAASYAYFRTFHRDVEDTIRNRGTPLAMPVLAVGGKGAPGQVIPDQAQLYAGDVTGAVLPCGHWGAEESPALLLEQLLPCLSSSRPELGHRKRSTMRRGSVRAQTQHQGVLDLRPRPA